MKNNLKAVLGLLLGLVLLVGCNPDDPQVATSRHLIRGTGKWVLVAQITTVESNSSDDYTIDYYELMDACWKDNIFYYTSAHGYQELAANIKCNSIETDIVQTGTWSLSSDGKQLSILHPDGIDTTVTDVYEVTQLNSFTLKLKSVKELNGDTFTTESTFTKLQ